MSFSSTIKSTTKLLVIERCSDHSIFFSLGDRKEIGRNFSYNEKLESNVGGVKTTYLTDCQELQEGSFSADNMFELEGMLKESDESTKQLMLKVRETLYELKSVSTYNYIQNGVILSVIIPTYNGASTIRRTLQNIDLALDNLGAFLEVQVIVLLDHCTDSTEEIVTKFAFSSPCVTDVVIEKSLLRGKANAMNQGYELSRGNLLLFLDDDILFPSNTISLLLAGFLNSKKAKLAYVPWGIRKLNTKNPIRIFWYWVFSTKHDCNIYTDNTKTVRGPMMLMRKTHYPRIPEGLINDDEFLDLIFSNTTLELNNSKILIYSVTSIKDYYRRFVRIKAGSRQVRSYISQDRINEHQKEFTIDYNKVKKLSMFNKMRFVIYRSARLPVKILANWKSSSFTVSNWKRVT